MVSQLADHRHIRGPWRARVQSKSQFVRVRGELRVLGTKALERCAVARSSCLEGSEPALVEAYSEGDHSLLKRGELVERLLAKRLGSVLLCAHCQLERSSRLRAIRPDRGELGAEQRGLAARDRAHALELGKQRLEPDLAGADLRLRRLRRLLRCADLLPETHLALLGIESLCAHALVRAQHEPGLLLLEIRARLLGRGALGRLDGHQPLPLLIGEQAAQSAEIATSPRTGRRRNVARAGRAERTGRARVNKGPRRRACRGAG
jgi:hypothetical protein